MPDKHEKCAVPPVHANAPHSKDTAVDDAGSAENKREPNAPASSPRTLETEKENEIETADVHSPSPSDTD